MYRRAIPHESSNAQVMPLLRWHALVHQIEQFNYIAFRIRTQPQLAGVPNLVLVLGAVNVDVASRVLALLLVQSGQAIKYATSPSPPWEERINRLSAHPTSKNSAAGVSPPIFSATRKRPVAFMLPFLSDAESRRGHRITADRRVAGPSRKLLIADRYVDVSRSLHRITRAINCAYGLKVIISPSLARLAL